MSATVETSEGGLDIARIGLGTAALGHLYHATDARTAQAVVRDAYETGIRFFDTAHQYGGGLAEERLGEALRGITRGSYRLSTKIGTYRPYGQAPTPPGSTVRGSADVLDFGFDRTLEAVETSLRRLATDRIDIVHVHGFDKQREGAEEGAFRALARLKAEGVVGAIGAATDAVEPLLWAIGRGLIDAVLIAGRHTLIDRSASRALLPAARTEGISTIVAGIFNSGILATGSVPGARFDYSEAPDEVVARVRLAEEMCAAGGVTLKHAALRFALCSPLVDMVLLGPADPMELREDLGLLSEPIDDQFWDAVDTCLFHGETVQGATR